MGIAIALTVGIALAVLWWVNRRSEGAFLAYCEFWIYTDAGTIPPYETVVQALVGGPGQKGIGTSGALLLTDVRLNMSHVSRQKNPFLFRPDLFAEAENASPEALSSIASSQALIRVRFGSSQPLKDNKPLQVTAHLAHVMLDLTDGMAVYDNCMEQLWTAEDFRARIDQRPDATTLEDNFRLIWTHDDEGRSVETRGLIKWGLPELKSRPLDADTKVLAEELMTEAGRKLWGQAALPAEIEVTCYGDTFKLSFGRPKLGKAPTQILRYQTRT